MSVRSVLVIVWCVWLSKTSLAQNVYEFAQPGLQNCYYIDTYKTDFEPGDELVRCERSFFKKLFKNWGRWGNNECTQCCPNTPGYSGGSAGNGDNMNGNGGYVNGNGYYKEEDTYDNGYEPLFNPQDVPAGHHGHIYMPLPHPHRVMSHLHHYFNRPFRRGYGGKVDPPGNYPPKEPAVEEKPEVPPPPKEEAADAYQEPAPVEETTSAYTEKPAYPSEEKYDQKEEDVDKNYDDKKYEKEETPTPAPAPVPAPVTTQVIQPIVPIIAPPVYVYQPQYYPPPGVQPISYMYPAPPSSSYSATPVQYNSLAQAGFSYSLPAPTYAQATPPVTSVQYNSPAAPVYSTPGPSYSPPASSYSQVQLQTQPQSIPTYTPPSPLSYSPSPPPSALPELAEPTLPCPFSNPSDCSYFKKTYSTSLTYLLPPQSPSSSYSNILTIPYDPNDQPMRSCPELFTAYQLSLQASTAPASQPY